MWCKLFIFFRSKVGRVRISTKSATTFWSQALWLNGEIIGLEPSVTVARTMKHSLAFSLKLVDFTMFIIFGVCITWKNHLIVWWYVILIYVAYTDLQSRKETRESAWRKPGWDECVAYTVPLIQQMHTKIMVPLPFSPTQ